MYTNKITKNKKWNNIWYKEAKKERGTQQVDHAESNKMEDLNLNTSIMTLNVNGLNSLHKGQRLWA